MNKWTVSFLNTKTTPRTGKLKIICFCTFFVFVFLETQLYKVVPTVISISTLKSRKQRQGYKKLWGEIFNCKFSASLFEDLFEKCNVILLQKERNPMYLTLDKCDYFVSWELSVYRNRQRLGSNRDQSVMSIWVSMKASSDVIGWKLFCKQWFDWLSNTPKFSWVRILTELWHQLTTFLYIYIFSPF